MRRGVARRGEYVPARSQCARQNVNALGRAGAGVGQEWEGSVPPAAFLPLTSKEDSPLDRTAFVNEIFNLTQSHP